MPRPNAPDWRDVQRLVLSGYRRLIHAHYALWTITKPALGHRWVAHILPWVTRADTRPESLPALNIAFSFSGLNKLLDLSPGDTNTFPLPFRQRMSGDVHRSRILGDVGPNNSPDQWQWGNAAQADVDVLLMVFDDNPDRITTARQKLSPGNFGLAQVAEFDSVRHDNREPFGFADGLSQPILEGTRRASRASDSRHIVKTGEILLGYPNNSGDVTPVPSADGDQAFGLNGTYLALRQLEQNVDGFWAFMDQHAPRIGLDRKALAEKIVGRTIDGEVLVPGGVVQPRVSDNEFGFAANDPYGEGCPLGAHIRRGNPRDTLHKNPMDSWAMVNQHRLLRRGRPYLTDNGERGLLFIALVGDIERQFEFVQQNWVNDAGFAELSEERDPLIGHSCAANNTFTIPAHPLRRQVVGLERFVTTRGGEYFLLPSLHALSHLAEP